MGHGLVSLQGTEGGAKQWGPGREGRGRDPNLQPAQPSSFRRPAGKQKTQSLVSPGAGGRPGSGRTRRRSAPPDTAPNTKVEAEINNKNLQ